MTLLMRRAIVAAAVVIGSCTSIAAHAYTDVDVQDACEQGHRSAMAQVARDHAKAHATTTGVSTQRPLPAPQPSQRSLST